MIPQHPSAFRGSEPGGAGDSSLPGGERIRRAVRPGFFPRMALLVEETDEGGPMAVKPEVRTRPVRRRAIGRFDLAEVIAFLSLVGLALIRRDFEALVPIGALLILWRTIDALVNGNPFSPERGGPGSSR